MKAKQGVMGLLTLSTLTRGLLLRSTESPLVVPMSANVTSPHERNVLHKMSHTFLCDIREFGTELLDLKIEDYLRSLPSLGYVQTLIYDIDLCGERALHPDLTELNRTWERVYSFLRDQKLYDSDIAHSLNELRRYQDVEKNLHLGVTISHREARQALALKSADLGLLKKLLLKITKKDVSQDVLEVFSYIDTIREVFDDIRDFEEDKHIINFNFVANSIDSGGPERAKTLVDGHLNDLFRNLHMAADCLRGQEKRRIRGIVQRLHSEREYYVGLLAKLRIDSYGEVQTYPKIDSLMS